MKRRSFLQALGTSIVAIPLVGTVATKAQESVATLRTKQLPKWDWRTGRFRHPMQTVSEGAIAASDIKAGSIVTYLGFTANGQRYVVPANTGDAPIGVVSKSVRAGDPVKMIVQGEVEVRMSSK